MDAQLDRLARRFLLAVVPQAAVELRRLKHRAGAIVDPDLRREALSSITHKDFHVHGGCILATFLPRAQAKAYIGLVATFETAVDYLDNLCDRTGSFDEADFRALHEALIDAVTPGAPLRRYFRSRTKDDGGYLAELVARAQQSFSALPSYGVAAPYVRSVTERYCELQALKHLAPGARERRCAAAFGAIAPDLEWWEGAASCGSTMPTFALAFGALNGCDARGASQLNEGYVPYISAFHILLDYFIDQAEDRAHAELNFVACYPTPEAARDGIARIGLKALARASALADGPPHRFAVRAMCAFYLSRAKVRAQALEDDAAAIARAVGVDLAPGAWNSRTSMLAPLLALYRRMIRVS